MNNVSTMHSLQKNTAKMTRVSKLYLKVDREGLLTDPLELSDVVNFDCYESIVGSARRIVAKYNGVSPECIEIDAVFYYKKRARSSRMNPVRLRTTTDGFRAVAEHPVGEVPLGVKWTKKYLLNPGGPKILVKVEPQSNEMQDELTSEEPKKTCSPAMAPRRPLSDSEIPEKTRKLDSSFRAVMLGVDDLKANLKSMGGLRRGPKAGTPDGQDTTIGSSNMGNQQRVQPDDHPVLNVNAQNKTDMEGETEKRYPSKSQYQWPDDVSVEVVLTYDGISERKTLVPGLAFVVQCLLKGNYSVLSREVAASLCLTKLPSKSQEVLNEMNQTSDKCLRPKIQEEIIQRAPIRLYGLMISFDPDEISSFLALGLCILSQMKIHDLQDAKTEIFKVLTLLNLSKARFKQLLEWMKALKLEEGKQGKFYLSERNVVGRGLKVTYDTNEEAAIKLNQIYKARATTNTAQLLHPIDTFATPVTTNTNYFKTTDDSGKHIMFLVPQTSTVVTPVPKTSSAMVGQLNTHTFMSQDVDVQNNASQVPVQVPVTSAQSPQTQNIQETSTKKPNSGHTLPSILRRKQKFPVQKPRQSSLNPTPMHLFRAYQSDQDSDTSKTPSGNKEPSESGESNSSPTLTFIKQEPVDYNSDATEDYERTSEKGLSPSAEMYGETTQTYDDVLKSDAQMPQSSEQNDKPFDVIIKSEPMDDY